MSQSQDKGFRRQVARRLLAKQRRAARTQADQQRAAVQREINRQLRGWTPRRISAWVLFGLALLIVVQHLLAHAGWRPIPLSMGWQDLIVGYPMAAALALGGAFVVEPRSTRG